MASFLGQSGPSCSGCCVMMPMPLTRRRVLGLAVGAAPAAFLPRIAAGADYGTFEAMLLTCIDPRFVEAARRFMAGQHWTGKYSQFSFAGAAVGVVAPKFAGWHQTFWDNLQITVNLHHIKRVVALDHRDCGAAKLAYGEPAVATRDAETETHRTALIAFRDEIGRRHPALQVVAGLIDRDGKIETFA